jgi:proteasome lid subunit RPN8/RPN11
MVNNIRLEPEVRAVSHQEKAPPWDNPLTWLCRWPREPNFYVFLHQRALRELVDHTRSNTAREVGGSLVGEFCIHQGRRFVEVHAAIWGKATKGNRTEITFTADTWASILVVQQREYPQYRIVGWYHTHPGHGVFLSDKDLAIHNNFFRETDHLALVVDPIHHQGQFYKGRGRPGRGIYASITFQWPTKEAL